MKKITALPPRKPLRTNGNIRKQNGHILLFRKSRPRRKREAPVGSSNPTAYPRHLRLRKSHSLLGLFLYRIAKPTRKKPQ